MLLLHTVKIFLCRRKCQRKLLVCRSLLLLRRGRHGIQSSLAVGLCPFFLRRFTLSHVTLSGLGVQSHKSEHVLKCHLGLHFICERSTSEQLSFESVSSVQYGPSHLQTVEMLMM